MHVNMDPNFVDNMVSEVKSQGVFDAFRRDSMADVDTKPAYQNLKQRVENTVTKFLSEQKWTPELNKNQMREKLRKHIIDAGFLEVGVQRIVDQVVNPKISTVFQPRIEDIVYKYLGIDKPEIKTEPKENQYDIHENLTVNTNLLPNDLEAVSPDSDKSTAKSETQFEEKYEEIEEDHEEEDDESPPFEPLERPSPSKIKEEDVSNYSHISGISGLTSRSGTRDEIKNGKNEEIKHELKEEADKNYNIQNSMGEFTQESQLSQVSSNSRLSIGSNDDGDKKSNYIQESSANVDISEEAQMPKFNENSNSYHPPNGETLHFDINKDEIKFEGTDRNNEILPPIYQSEMLESNEDKNRLESNRQISITQNVEEISNGTFNTESRNSTYFDDDSERGGLQIIEDPTQDFSTEQSRPSSTVFQKPENKDEKNSPEENLQTLSKASVLETQEQIENKHLESTSPTQLLKINNSDSKSDNSVINKSDSTEKSISLQKTDDKQKALTKSSSTNRHSSSSSSHKSHRSKDKKHDREKDKGRKSSSSDSKLSSESYQSKNHSNGRHSSQSSPRSSNSTKVNSTNHYKSSNKHSASYSCYKNENKVKNFDKDRDRKRDHDHSRDEKSIKSDKQKSKEYDDHSYEKNKRHHRKSTDSNDGDKKGYSSSKGQKNSKGLTVGTSNEEIKADCNNLNNPEGSHVMDVDSFEEQRDSSFKTDAQTEEKPKSVSKCGKLSPIMIENLNMENIEFIIGSNLTNFQKNSFEDSSLISKANYTFTKLEYQHEDKQYNSEEKLQNTFEPENKNLSTEEKQSTMPLIFESSVTKPEIMLPVIKKSPQKNRFETLISPPPKKRKYDISFNDSVETIIQKTQTNSFIIPNIYSCDENREINLFGFDIQEEQENYRKIINDYKECYDTLFQDDNSIFKSVEIDDKANINSMISFQKSTYTTDNKTILEHCHSSVTNNEEFELSGKSLTINCIDYDLVPNNPSKKKTRMIALQPTEILHSKVSPSLSDSSISSKENKYLEEKSYYIKKTKKGSDVKKLEKKSNLPTLLTTQRYACDDLYKPRLSKGQRSRRRALNNDIL